MEKVEAAGHMESLVIEPNVYYTLDEAAHLLRVSRLAMLRLVRSGRPRGVNIGRQWRILGGALIEMSAPMESDSDQVSDWLAASASSLAEIWDNDEDAAYDRV